MRESFLFHHYAKLYFGAAYGRVCSSLKQPALPHALSVPFLCGEAQSPLETPMLDHSTLAVSEMTPFPPNLTSPLFPEPLCPPMESIGVSWPCPCEDNGM